MNPCMDWKCPPPCAGCTDGGYWGMGGPVGIDWGSGSEGRVGGCFGVVEVDAEVGVPAEDGVDSGGFKGIMVGSWDGVVFFASGVSNGLGTRVKVTSANTADSRVFWTARSLLSEPLLLAAIVNSRLHSPGFLHFTLGTILRFSASRARASISTGSLCRNFLKLSLSAILIFRTRLAALFAPFWLFCNNFRQLSTSNFAAGNWEAMFRSPSSLDILYTVLARLLLPKPSMEM